MNDIILYIGEFFKYISENSQEILKLLSQHIELTALSVLVAIIVGVPLGIIISKYAKLNKPVMGFANVVQAIPSMAILGFLIPILGIGKKPAIFMVVLYSLLPIIKNTATGLANINKDTIEAARGIGMTELQILFKVQFPMALPVIMAGIRISAVTSVGLMTLAAYIGAGGLGYLIYSGVQMVNNYMILAGAIPACILALLMDFLFGRIEKAVTALPLRKNAVLPDSKEDLLKLRKRRRVFLSSIAVIMAIIIFFVAFGDKINIKNTVTVTSKYYPEQLLLGNMAADLIEDKTNLNVVRKLNMSGTKVCLDALVTGEVDVHVEYTGSMYAGVLNQPLSSDNEHIYNTIKTMYKEEYDLNILGDWGFNNTYSLAMKRSVAEKYQLETISDLARVSKDMIFSPTFEFANREDGMLGLNKAYGLSFKEIAPIDGGLKYTALDTGGCDIIVAYTTDAQVERYDLKVLKDDKSFFMPYHAVPIIRADTLEKYPELKEALNTLEQELTDEIMVKLNYEIEVLGRKPEEVSKEYLKTNGYIK